MRKKLNGLLAVLLLGTMLITGCGPKQTSNPGTQKESESESDATQKPSESESETLKPWEKKYEATGRTNLKESITADLGEDTIVGCVINGSTINNEKLMNLVHEHFNAVTFENENKPQFSFADTYAKKSRTTSYELNGQTVEMPILNFNTPDKLLDVLLAWNQEHPDKFIKVRGHVLVWHGQTPEWFFHEDFDESKPYVTKEVMDVRQEWYIKSVLEHFCGEDSKYKGMYYGWDVVNEACSDGTGKGYRKDTEGSSWWAVYQSEEFIVNAFKYANKYAPADVALYYNDYGDCSSGKVSNISKLLAAVKDAEGAPGVGTRIDGMGMQAHYSISGPSTLEMMAAGRIYGKYVDKVMLTEFDWNVNNSYDGTEESKRFMFTKQGQQYKDWYDQLNDLEAKGVVDVAGITVWCVTDQYSWLQSANSAGGGADGKSEQFPALFDSNYQPKPSFWALVDPSRMSE